MDFAKLFSFEGRIGRQEYWLTYLSLTVLYVLALYAVQQSKVLAVMLLALPLVIFYVWVSFAFTVKRLHDTGRSGWWLFKMGAASVALAGVLVVGLVGITAGLAGKAPAFLMGLSATGSFAVLVIAGLLMTALNLYSLWVIGIMRGDSADNAYGAPDSGSTVRG